VKERLVSKGVTDQETINAIDGQAKALQDEETSLAMLDITRLGYLFGRKVILPLPFFFSCEEKKSVSFPKERKRSCVFRQRFPQKGLWHWKADQTYAMVLSQAAPKKRSVSCHPADGTGSGCQLTEQLKRRFIKINNHLLVITSCYS